MEEPLLSTRRLPSSPPGLFCSLPEDDELAVEPVPTTPTFQEIKEMLIFGSPSSPQSNFSDSSSPNRLQGLSLASASPNSTSGVGSERIENTQQWLIDPDYAPSKRNLHRSKTAPAMAAINEVRPSEDTNHPLFEKPSIVGRGVLYLLLYLSLGVAIYSFNRHNFKASETHPVVDALYFCIVTMCTIGYGDITPDSAATKMFSIMFVLVGFGFIDVLLTGMVSYVLDLQENHLLKTVKNRGSYVVDVQKGRMRIRMKVALALAVVTLCIGIGGAVMHFVEELDWMDSFYLSVMSVTTVGYGDRAFTSLSGRIFASIWLLVSTLAVARAFLYLAEARVDKRHRRMAKWVLDRNMTVAQFFAADINNNGFVSRSEYIICKLKEMGKVSEKDIQSICRQFDRLDTGNCGKITLADLMENNCNLRKQASSNIRHVSSHPQL